MRTTVLVTIVGLVLATNAIATNPVASVGGGSTPNIMPPDRDACWSEPPDLNGLIASSEIISWLGLETEIANDFLPSAGYAITMARWWGGYWGTAHCEDIGYASHWNLRFYENPRGNGPRGLGGPVGPSTLGVSCLPRAVISETLNADAHETYIYCQSGYYPICEYTVDVSVSVDANQRYWFGCQSADHTYPPQCGRLASAEVVGCDSMFRSAFFSYPDWTPALEVFGVSYDASQEFWCGATSTRHSTWGAVKGLYR
jgi:hypothetical protein